MIDEAFARVPPLLIGDKGFDSIRLANELADRDIELVAARQKNRQSRKQDGRRLRRYKRRWKVERLFAWLKRYRRINTRWDRKAQNYLGFLHLGCIVLLLRHF